VIMLTISSRLINNIIF